MKFIFLFVVLNFSIVQAFGQPISNEIQLFFTDTNYHSLDSFNLKYEIDFGNKQIKKVDKKIYAGIINTSLIINNFKYEKMILGDSLENIIAFVRQDENKLSYIDITDVETSIKNIAEDLNENVLFYFDTTVNSSWKVNIKDSYFEQKKIKLIETKFSDDGEIYIYDVENDEGFLDWNYISKIYFSKKKGFIKFEIKTHYGNMQATKLN